MRSGAEEARANELRERVLADLTATLRSEYERGASIRQLAERIGSSDEVVHNVLVEAEVELRGRHAPLPGTESEPRNIAHRLVDEVPSGQLPTVIELLRREAGQAEPGGVRRRFRTVGVFEGDPDLGRRAKEIARHELGTKPDKTA